MTKMKTLATTCLTIGIILVSQATAYADADVAINDSLSQDQAESLASIEPSAGNTADALKGPYGQYLKKGSKGNLGFMKKRKLGYPDIPPNATDEERTKLLTDAHKDQSGQGKGAENQK